MGCLIPPGVLPLAACVALAFLAACGSESPVSGGTTGPRVVTLAPHLTELVFAAGAGDALVGAVEYSDYPPAARDVPRIGDAFRVDVERIAALAPDVILAWQSGNPSRAVAQLRDLGFSVLVFEPRTLDDVAADMETIGERLGHRSQARMAAAAFRDALAALRARYGSATPVSVFYQISDRPLYTFGGAHIVNEILTLCGGVNIFGDLGELAPAVAREAVLARNPEAIIMTFDAGDDAWTAWPDLRALRYGNVFELDASLLNRSGPRMADGAQALCDVLETARVNRAGAA